VRLASDAPARFVSTPTGNTVPADSVDTALCRNPFFDPRDATRVVPVRSAQGQGDYAVPNLRYGVGADELLRVDCRTGAPIGIVRR
jgi:hypothetical protein